MLTLSAMPSRGKSSSLSQLPIGAAEPAGDDDLQLRRCRHSPRPQQDEEEELHSVSSATCPHENNTRARTMAPGSPCTQKIFGFAVTAPNTPARVMHARKKILIESPLTPRTRPHTSPAARKPLYRP